MNILIKSTYPQGDGWGRSARDYLRAFVETNHSVKASPIVLCRNVIPKESLPSWIPENVINFIPNVYFQQCLPDYFEYFDRVKNIGFSFTETKNLQYTGWIEKFNEMDEVWVATEIEKKNLQESGVKKNVQVVKMPFDFSIDSDEGLDDLQEIINGRFSFYFIGEFVHRKNIDDLLLAYWREFDKSDDTVLVLKTNINGVSAENTAMALKQHIDNLQKAYRIYEYAHRYPEIVIITDNLSDLDMSKFHNSCDCFVTASYGESTCRPLVEAAYRNNALICTDDIGAIDYNLKIAKVKSKEVPCFTSQPPMPYIYTARETWMKVDIFDLQNKMRMAYNKEIEKNNKESVISTFSSDVITKRIIRLLEN